MIVAVRTELFKLRTTRTTAGMLAAGVGLSGATAAVKASRAGGSGHMAIGPLYTADGLTKIIASTDFALLLTLAFGVAVAAGEFRHQTATATFLTQPARRRVLAAKLIAGATVGLLFGLLGGLVTTAVGLGFVTAHGYHVALGTGTIVRYILGATLAGGLLAAVGVGVGSLIRTQLGAVISVLCWGLFVEQIIGSLFDWLAPYLPYTAATTLGGASPGSGISPLPFAAAALLVAAVALLVASIAGRTTVAMDIT
ncbi:MAG TPA: hypothetical protein VHC49_14780 [Mycobacteriales bacterium]|nr:hypothetical protein [Mycobacteriales bacterium]